MTKKRTMRHQLLILLSVGIVLFFFFINIGEKPSITGASLMEETERTYAVRLHHIANDFFEIDGLQFPEGGCGEIAQQLYSHIVSSSVDETSGFYTSGKSRLATLGFDMDQKDTFGTLDMIKGPVLMNGKPDDSFISISAEAIVRIPKEIKTTYYFMDLYGTSDGVFVVNRGSFSTPTADCSFVVNDGMADCKCNVHRVSGIRTGGITALRPIVEE